MSNSPQIDWVEGQPQSRQYQDVYFSSDSGLDETRHVFLIHNKLKERWQALARNHFTIGETGFGTGLNFLCAWQLWNEYAPPSARMHFVSIEKHPLTLPDLKRALSLWPQLAEQRDQMLAQYQWLVPGFHRFVFDKGRVTLTLLIGDINIMLPRLVHGHIRAFVDAWFLDGFSPAKNPEMWEQGIFQNMARLSHHATTFSTFTSAGEVRRGLETAGFKVHKVEGFGRKREMLCGQYDTSVSQPEEAHDKRAIVIGGGIAGTASSHALASRGWQVQLIERHNELAQEASGNPVGVLYPRMAIKDIAPARLALSGFLHTLRLLQQIDPDETIYRSCGLLQLAFNVRESVRFKAIAGQEALNKDTVRYVDKACASSLAGVDLMQDALYFPAAGWAKPPAFCALLAKHERIQMMLAAQALKLSRNGQLWQVWDNQRMLAEAPVVIISNANDAMNFEQSSHLQLQPVRGQITMIEPTIASSRLKTIICTDGYISPVIDGQQSIGATFSLDDNGTETRAEDHQDNLAMLWQLAPQLHEDLKSRVIGGRAALRCTTPDHIPAVGLLLDAAAILANPPRHNTDPANLPWQQGLYINTGHGSKGLITTPLCAEILASAICGEPLPVDVSLFAALDPNRFLLKKMGLKRLLAPKSVHTSAANTSIG